MKFINDRIRQELGISLMVIVIDGAEGQAPDVGVRAGEIDTKDWTLDLCVEAPSFIPGTTGYRQFCWAWHWWSSSWVPYYWAQTQKLQPAQGKYHQRSCRTPLNTPWKEGPPKSKGFNCELSELRERWILIWISLFDQCWYPERQAVRSNTQDKGVWVEACGGLELSIFLQACWNQSISLLECRRL